MRQPRILVKGAKYHVFGQFHRKEFGFEEDAIKDTFLAVFADAHQKYQFVVHSFVLMNNHYHIIIEPLDDENLSRIMQWILGVFAQKYNKIFNYVGHVWRGRFQSKVIESEYQYEKTVIYLADNPVTASLVEKATDWVYSSCAFCLDYSKREFFSHIMGGGKVFVDSLIVLYKRLGIPISIELDRYGFADPQV